MIACATVAPLHAHAQSALDQPAQEGLRRLEERRREQQRALQPQADVLRPAPMAAPATPIPDEQPCFVIHDIALAGPDRQRFAWLLESAQPFLQRCIGVQGLRKVVATLDAKLIERGYVTTRVSLPAQNLASGELQLQLHVGRVAEVRMIGAGAPDQDDTAWGTWRNAFLLREGDVLNVRSLEQGVEQMKRLPSQSVTTTLEPGAAPDTSVVVIERTSGRLSERLRGAITLDNSGQRSLGRTQLGANAAFDNPLGLNDIVTLSVSSNAEQPRSDHRSQSAAIGYSVPLGFSTFSLNRSHSRFAQNVQLTTTRVLSSGESDASELKWQHVAWRTAAAKTSVHAVLSTRRARSFLDDSENLVQRRRTTQLETGIGHRQLLSPAASVEFELGYRRGVPWLDAQDDFPAEAGALTLRPRLWTLDARYAHAFKLRQRPLEYSVGVRAQHTRDATLAIDQIAIGGRSSVRGFDGDSVLLAESGWLVRNELSTPVPWPGGLNGSVYLGLDAGRVWGASSALLVGDKLAGTALGLRGQWQALVFDVALAAPLHKPHGFQTRRVSPYISLTATF